MTGLVIGNQLLTEGLRIFMANTTGRPFGIMEAPQTVIDEPLEDVAPYGYLEPLEGMERIGGWGGNWRQARFPYAMYSFGVNKQQTVALADRIGTAFLDSSILMTITGYDIIDRLPDPGQSRSSPELAGTNLWSVRESFILHAESV